MGDQSSKLFCSLSLNKKKINYLPVKFIQSICFFHLYDSIYYVGNLNNNDKYHIAIFLFSSEVNKHDYAKQLILINYKDSIILSKALLSNCYENEWGNGLSFTEIKRKNTFKYKNSTHVSDLIGPAIFEFFQRKYDCMKFIINNEGYIKEK